MFYVSHILKLTPWVRGFYHKGGIWLYKYPFAIDYFIVVGSLMICQTHDNTFRVEKTHVIIVARYYIVPVEFFRHASVKHYSHATSVPEHMLAGVPIVAIVAKCQVVIRAISAALVFYSTIHFCVVIKLNVAKFI